MTTIPIHWLLDRRGNWDHGTLMLAEEGILSPNSGIRFERIDAPRPGAVVCFNGNNRDAWPLVRELRGCLVAVLSDESCECPPDLVHPSNVVWQQYGRLERHANAAKWLLTGLRRETPETIVSERRNAEILPRLRWSFVGQLQHDVRRAFHRAALGSGCGPSVCHVATGFGGLGSDGFSYRDYIRSMLRSDFVICPPGNVSPDAFRFAEALECGAIPIVTGRSYWRRVFNNNPFLPAVIVDSADEIPGVLAWDQSRVDATRAACAEAWTAYKRIFVEEMAEAVGRLACAT